MSRSNIRAWDRKAKQSTVSALTSTNSVTSALEFYLHTKEKKIKGHGRKEKRQRKIKQERREFFLANYGRVKPTITK